MPPSPPAPQADARLAVLAPSPILTVTLEREGGEPELHLHPGGQGFWVARMARELGATVGFCAPLGGEVGTVLRPLIEREKLELSAVETAACSGSYVHERRRGGLIELVRVASPRLLRHEADALYTTMLSVSSQADLAVLTGADDDELLDVDFFRRLAGDLQRNGRTVAADLSGAPLVAALAGGIDVLHVSERELREHLQAALRDRAEMATAIERVREHGIRYAIVSRGSAPALALLDTGIVEVIGPTFDTREHRGAGDSMFAAVAVSLARGQPIDQALRLGVAAGALNASRRGLGTGRRGDIERLASSVELRPLL